MTGLSDQITAHLVKARFEHLPPEAIIGAKRALLDALGVSLAATQLGEGCSAFLDMAASDAGTPRATILGRRPKVPPQQAAFANGALAHAMDFEDTHDASATHPNSASVPAALAIAETLNASGQELILALAISCDFVCRLGLGLEADPSEHGWYTPAIVSAFGAGIAAATLLQLDQRGMLDTLSLTLCQATCSAEIKRSPHSLIRSIREAFSAQAGVQAALLAQKGITGFDLPLEGKAGFYGLYGNGRFNKAALTKGLGQRFEGAYLSFKPWPTCRGTHVYIDILLRLMHDHHLNRDQIEVIEIDVNSLNLMLCAPETQKLNPRTLIDAKFSLPFTLAFTALYGEPSLDEFTPDRLNDPAILSLAAHIKHRVNSDWPYQQATRGRLTLRLKDGRSFTLEDQIAPGHPERPLSQTQLENKFRSCAAKAALPLTSTQSDEVIKIIADLEHHKTKDLILAIRADH
ncbi:MAG: MmgE/PrpD family protein [Alphaproteobacteria bacterium]|nr:MmgE/PrpD family protein [Alphaproteobacteria bacterium]